MSSNSLIELGDSEEISYQINNRWEQPLGRISEYDHPIELRKFRYRLVARARLVTAKMIGIRNHLHLIEETCPHKKVRRRKLNKLRLRSLLLPTVRIDYEICCLIDGRGWHRHHFHWLLDFLPRVIAAEDHAARTGGSPMLLVTEDMSEKQSASLHYLGWDTTRQLPINPSSIGTSVHVKTLIAASGARQQSIEASPNDAISPRIVNQISERLSSRISGSSIDGLPPERIYVSRAKATCRRILNEDDLVEIISPYGFVSVTPEDLSLEEQVRLFRGATHVIGPHGGGLTNLIFAENAHVLEIFARNHGIRPDYFQISNIRSLEYYFLVCESVNDQDDMIVDLAKIGEFLELAL